MEKECESFQEGKFDENHRSKSPNSIWNVQVLQYIFVYSYSQHSDDDIQVGT